MFKSDILASYLTLGKRQICDQSSGPPDEASASGRDVNEIKTQVLQSGRRPK